MSAENDESNSRSKTNGGVDLTPTDRSLVVLVRDGSEEAASLLYDRYARRILGLVRSKLGDKLATQTDPEDIVQSVFRSVFRGVKSGNYEAPPGETLWSLMAVIAIRKLHNTAAHHHASCRDISRNVTLESGIDAEAVANYASPDFLIMCVREILDHLRPIEQTIIQLRMEGCTIAEISEKSGRTKRTVERILQQVRKKLTGNLLQDEDV